MYAHPVFHVVYPASPNMGHITNTSAYQNQVPNMLQPTFVVMEPLPPAQPVSFLTYPPAQPTPVLCPFPVQQQQPLQPFSPQQSVCSSPQLNFLRTPSPPIMQQSGQLPFHFSPSPSPDFQPAQQLNPYPPSPLFAQQICQSPCHLNLPLSPNFQPVVSENCGPRSIPSSAENCYNSSLEKLFQKKVNQSKKSVEEIQARYTSGAVDSFNRTVKCDLPLTVRFINSPKKEITIEWFVNRDDLDARWNLDNIKRLIQRRDFDDRLTCEMSKIDGGSFGAHLNRCKQLTIQNEGWNLLEALRDSLMSRGGLKEVLLNLAEEQRFDDEVVENLYKVSEDEQGKALRGRTVCCGRFKHIPDILKMRSFIDAVKQHGVPIMRSTMIPSLKTGKQYKGWSLYLDVATKENVQIVKQIAGDCNFEKTQIEPAPE
jgi:hypothetical protein